ncbi:MAG: hypothetical protein K8T25_24010 [Planctomycetia bacterium]|nr:hypothetical protein [Planctomycetia bacterium]
MTKRAHVTRKQVMQPVNRIGEQAVEATESAVEFFKDYARERPEVVALWAFGIGFALGWKLKPW